MKINKLYTAIFILTTALFSACSEYEDSVVLSPVVSEDNPAIRFDPENVILFEFEPAGDLSFTLSVMRDNITAALEVPVSVITNTENSFDVPSTLSFEAGESYADLTITMNSSAPTGVDLPITITFDDEYVNPYKTEYATYYGKVSITKWNSLGTVQFYDSFSFSKVAEVTLEQRDDKSNVYRINSPYQEGILLDAGSEGWIGGTTQDKIVFTVEDNNVVWDSFWYTNLLYEGNAGQEIKAYLPSVLEKDGDEQSIVVKNDDESISYFELYPCFYIDGVGSYGLNVVYLGLPGYDLAGALGLSVYSE